MAHFMELDALTEQLHNYDYQIAWLGATKSPPRCRVTLWLFDSEDDLSAIINEADSLVEALRLTLAELEKENKNAAQT